MRGREGSARLAFVAFVAASLAFVVGCRQQERCHALADRSVVACVGAEPVPRAEAQEFLGPAEWIPGSATKQDPRPVAVDKAIDLLLLAGEAKRRGLGPAGSPAALA